MEEAVNRSLAVASLVAVSLVLAAGAARAADVPEEEARAWAKKVEETVAGRDPAFLDAAIDMKAFVARAFKGFTVSDAARKDFAASLAGSPLGAAIVKSLGEQGTWKFVRLGTRDGAPVAVFRFTNDEQAFDFKELFFEKDAKGTIRVVDLFTYLGGERMTAILRRGGLVIAAHEDKTIREHLEGAEREYVTHVDELTAFTKLVHDGDGKAALAAYKKLPAALQKDRNLLLLRWRAAQALDDEKEFKAALDAIDASFKGDAALLLLDRAFLVKDWPKVFAMLDALEKSVGPDAYLDFQRACTHNAKGDKKTSKAAAEKAIAKEPDLLVAHWHLIGLALEEKDWSAVAKGLDRVTEQGVELADLTGVEQFAGFVKSDEYAAWKKARDARKKPAR